MFDPKKSKYARDKQKDLLPGLPHNLAIPGKPLEEVFSYNSPEKYLEALYVMKSNEHSGISRLVNLFNDHIDKMSFEYIHMFGFDVMDGLYSFGDYKEDPGLGLCLVYQEIEIDAMPIGFSRSRLFLGVYQTPANYDAIFEQGVPDTISLENDYSFILAVEDKDLTKPESRLITDIFEEAFLIESKRRREMMERMSKKYKEKMKENDMGEAINGKGGL